MSERSYYPYLGDILTSGNLIAPTAETLNSGEKVCGAEKIGPQHPNYVEWQEAVKK